MAVWRGLKGEWFIEHGEQRPVQDNRGDNPRGYERGVWGRIKGEFLRHARFINGNETD